MSLLSVNERYFAPYPLRVNTPKSLTYKDPHWQAIEIIDEYQDDASGSRKLTFWVADDRSYEVNAVFLSASTLTIDKTGNVFTQLGRRNSLVNG